MDIYLTSDIRRLDAAVVDYCHIGSIDLMERAAKALTEAIMSHWPERDARFFIFAGPGNNGGDALAIARMLLENGYRPKTFLFNPKDALSDDCKVNLERLRELLDCGLTEVTTQFEPPKLDYDDVVIDGLFGSGVNKPLTGGFASVVRYLNASKAQVVSIDMPSGLMGEDNSNNEMNSVVRADYTLTLQQPKLSFLFPENKNNVGAWHAIDIGIRSEMVPAIHADYTLVEQRQMAMLVNVRDRFAHKGDFGRALLVAGQLGMAGASVLGAKACLRCGVGLLTVHVPQCNNTIVQSAVPEAMTLVDADELCFTQVPDLGKYKAVGVGPGLGQSAKTAAALAELVSLCTVPMVLDADALNLMAQNRGLLKRLPKHSVLTPHPAEFDRLAGRSTDSFARLMKARSMAQEYGVVIVLKGAYTAVITPDGHCSFNTTGNPGMATGGSGDVLTGVILSLLAQGMPAADAARLGVYAHGLAGDIAAKQYGEIALNASDIVAALPKAWKMLEE